MLVEKIRKEQITARKEKNKELSGLLTFMLGEIDKIGKDDGNRPTTDEEAIKVINKLNKASKEWAEKSEEADKRAEYQREVDVYSRYLPKLMSEDETQMAVDNILRGIQNPSMKDMGKVMSKLKKEYTDLDMGIASKIVKKSLN